MLPRSGVLLGDLILKMFLPLLKHFQLGAETKDSVLGGILALLRGGAAKPRPHLCVRDAISPERNIEQRGHNRFFRETTR